MKGGIVGVLVVSAIVLAAIATAMVRGSWLGEALVAGAARAAERPPQAAPADGEVPALTSDTVRPLEDLVATRERPLFFVDRRYPELPDEPGPEQTGGEVDQTPLKPLGPKNLSAIVIDDSETVALIQDADSGTLKRYRVGDSLDGWKVTEIRPDAVVVGHGDRSETLSLWNFSPRDTPEEPPGKARGARSSTPSTGSRSGAEALKRLQEIAARRRAQSQQSRGQPPRTSKPSAKTEQGDANCGLSRC